MAETLSALTDLVRSGKVRAKGPAEITPGSILSRPRSAKMDRSRAGQAGPGGPFGRSPALSGAALP
jgi:hypothetical protein